MEIESPLDKAYLPYSLLLTILTADTQALTHLLHALSDKTVSESPEQLASIETSLIHSLRAIAHSLLLEMNLASKVLAADVSSDPVQAFRPQSLVSPLLSQKSKSFDFDPRELATCYAQAMALLLIGQPQVALSALPTDDVLNPVSAPVWHAVGHLCSRIMVWANGLPSPARSSRVGLISPETLVKFPLIAALNQLLDRLIHADIAEQGSLRAAEIELPWLVCIDNAFDASGQGLSEDVIRPFSPLMKAFIRMAHANQLLNELSLQVTQSEQLTDKLTRAGRQLEELWKTAQQSQMTLFQAMTARLVAKLYSLLAQQATSEESRRHYEMRQRAFEQQVSQWTPWQTAATVIPADRAHPTRSVVLTHS
jgi:hypothetical protein